MDPESVEVVYALPDEQRVVTVKFVAGMTALEAVQRSQLRALYPEITRAPLVLGKFGVAIEHGHRLQPGDRVEICRPLQADPRERRKALARQGLVIGERAPKAD